MGTELEEALGEEVNSEVVEQPEVVEAVEEAGVKEEVSTPEPTPEPKTVPLDALEDERRKRQELERRLEAIDQKLTPKPEPEEQKDIWDDTQGWQQQFGSQVVSTAVEEANNRNRISTSEMLARRENPDFDALKEKYLAMAKENPVLDQQAFNDPDPWAFAIKTVKNSEQMAQLGATNIDEMREALRKELAEEAASSAGITLPPTTAGQRNVGARTGPAWGGPTSLEKALGES